ncbi:prolyl-tRNA synthetase [Streptomyces sp. TLI_235]|nr:hypothetical protein [Streptomyces sp. TLI_235]PBC66228.1 prolyl-tRNA synthetase [Streptomyces sp. TLI_235]
MTDALHHQALVAAGLLAPTGVGSGITAWRGPGLQVVRRMVGTFLDRVATVAPPAETEHPFLDPHDSYHRVFPDYANVYRLPEPDRAGWVLRADNLHLNSAWLRRTGHRGPVVTTGGLLRTMRGSGSPLFRERYIWPAVQLSHLLPAGTGEETLLAYRSVLERTFAAFGLPALTIAVDAPAGYGETCHLTVSCLRDGRPTILATTYLMARRYREALGIDGELVDIGFTGKVLALAAMHHHDRFGLGLPSALAPVHLALLPHGGPGGAELTRWADGLSGVRTASAPPHEAAFRRRRAERTLLRSGAPVAVGLPRDDDWRITRRGPFRRDRLPGPPTADDLRAELDGYDRRLLAAARDRFDRGLADLVRGACDGCVAARTIPVYGRIVPRRPLPCAHCGSPGEAVLLSERGRFY